MAFTRRPTALALLAALLAALPAAWAAAANCSAAACPSHAGGPGVGRGRHEEDEEAVLLQRRTSSHGGGRPRWPQEAMHCEGEPVAVTKCMTVEDYREVGWAVVDLLESLPADCDKTYCPQADFAGCVLQLAAHDFLDYDPEHPAGTSGPDGCFELSAHINSGIAGCLHRAEHGKMLAHVYKDFCSKVSLADFIVIAAEAVMADARSRAMEEADREASMDFEAQFQFGRSTSKACPGAAGALPSPEDGCGGVKKVMVKRLGLSWRETAALMAGHGLGRAQQNISGYHGWWLEPEEARRFDNTYHLAMVTRGWTPEPNVAGNRHRNQWKRSDEGADPSFEGHQMMLNSDLCLVYDDPVHSILPAAAKRGPMLAGHQKQDGCCAWVTGPAISDAVDTYLDGKSCGFAYQHNARERCCGVGNPGDCGDRAQPGRAKILPTGTDEDSPDGLAAKHVLEFAKSDDTWTEEFLLAWKKATELGVAGLQALKESC